MYYYRISEGEYEYECTRTLSHEYAYSPEEFKKIVVGAINYNKKHKQDDNNDIFLIAETLVDIYGFQVYRLPIQASVSDDWKLERISQ